MPTGMVFTFVGADKPGLIDQLANTVSSNGGNWLESRMSELAGHFAGIVHVSVQDAQLHTLRSALEALGTDALTIVVATDKRDTPAVKTRSLQLSILGHDRPGIVREVSHALAQHRINVREMDTSISSAPMSGDALFSAAARIDVPESLDIGELKQQLGTIADALTVDIHLDENAA